MKKPSANFLEKRSRSIHASPPVITRPIGSRSPILHRQWSRKKKERRKKHGGRVAVPDKASGTMRPGKKTLSVEGKKKSRALWACVCRRRSPAPRKRRKVCCVGARPTKVRPPPRRVRVTIESCLERTRRRGALHRPGRNSSDEVDLNPPIVRYFCISRCAIQRFCGPINARGLFPPPSVQYRSGLARCPDFPTTMGHLTSRYFWRLPLTVEFSCERVLLG